MNIDDNSYSSDNSKSLHLQKSEIDPKLNWEQRDHQITLNLEPNDQRQPTVGSFKWLFELSIDINELGSLISNSIIVPEAPVTRKKRSDSPPDSEEVKASK